MSNVLKFPDIDGIDLLIDRLERELAGEDYTSAIAFTLILIEDFMMECSETDASLVVYQKLIEINSILRNYTDVV